MDIEFDALNEPSRRAIIALLALEGELCVCEIVAALDEAQPKISRHLGILRDAGWVLSRREGTWMHYRLAALPDWARKVVAGLAEGGVPPQLLHSALDRLRQFDGRPPRQTEPRQMEKAS